MNPIEEILEKMNDTFVSHNIENTIDNRIAYLLGTLDAILSQGELIVPGKQILLRDIQLELAKITFRRDLVS